MSHPALGLPPRDMSAGRPAAAARLRADRVRLAARALEVAVDLDPTIRDRYDEHGLRRLLHDVDGYIDRLAAAVSAGEPALFKQFAEMSAPVYRRRRVPMDDLVTLLEGLRRACASVLGPLELELAGTSIDEGMAAYRYWRRFAGDARRRNAILHAIYKGG